MAKKTTVQLVDDIDETIIDDGTGESIEFSVSGVDYVIDLRNKNATEFHRKLDYYIEHATRVGGRRRRPSPAGAVTPSAESGSAATNSKPKRDPEQTRAIRQWAVDQGYDISERGRIPADIEEAYNTSH
ncbi:Lsr2 family protein [Rhodococcus sp. 14-2470-1a]|uniref:histone-like nucleoid-structuring protein Lsr2 n=1 Tax=Rhodococcus sp. 14-2470-1a TaxID=2023150 RepID=UPI000B9BFBB3|nr:Lsr2 family protein [Rhodococcus sp. 14-2470-1a]OZF42007.1 hypothetical protein CH292_26235 [Rhodococcus sp. 14-2470-1a]